jgi:hypothetical protein
MSRGRPFEPGNTFGRGRPKGSKNNGISAGRRLLEDHEDPLTRKTLSVALKDNTRALLWCMNQLKQPAPQATKLKLGPIKTADDVAKALGEVVNAVAKHKCTAADGQVLCNMLGEIRKMIEAQELAARVEELEALVKKDGSK